MRVLVLTMAGRNVLHQAKVLHVDMGFFPNMQEKFDMRFSHVEENLMST